MHDEDVGDEEEPGDDHNIVLILIIQLLSFLRDPLPILRLSQVTNRIAESLQNVDHVLTDEWIRFVVVASFQDQSDH